MADASASPTSMKLLCWNIYGLQSRNLKFRTIEISDVINREKPEVVFLQEVICATEKILQQECPEYELLPANDKNYFTAIMLRKSQVSLEEHTVQPFPSSVMGRKLQTVKCIVKNVPCTLMTSHLESMDSHDEERRNQLQTAFKAMEEAEGHRTTIFGGDLNLRDKEIAAIGGLPKNIIDLWEVTGSRPEFQYTWDYWQGQLNHVKVANGARHRFDRVYLRRSSPETLVPVDFKLVGLEKLASCHDFPSDHWGVLVSFGIIHRR